MKNSIRLLMALLGLATSAANGADIQISDYMLVSGGFGRDGATATSMPQPNSTANAKAIFDAMTGEENSRGRKSAGFEFGGDRFGIECTEQSCAFMVVQRKLPVPFVEFDTKVEITGAAARAIFAGLAKSTEINGVAGPMRVVSNLSCNQVTNSCSISHVNMTAAPLDVLVNRPEDREAVLKLVEAAAL